MHIFKIWNYITILFLCLNILNAQQYSSITLGPVTIQWLNLGTKTNFIATLNYTALNINNAWLAVGINSIPLMSNANSVVCRNNPIYSSIQHYLNAARTSDLLSATNPTIGISNGIVGNVMGTLTCIFTRDNMNNASNYFQITPTSSFYILTAFGPGNLSFHGFQNRFVSSSRISFAINPTTASTIISTFLSTNSTTKPIISTTITPKTSQSTTVTIPSPVSTFRSSTGTFMTTGSRFSTFSTTQVNTSTTSFNKSSSSTIFNSFSSSLRTTFPFLNTSSAFPFTTNRANVSNFTRSLSSSPFSSQSISTISSRNSTQINFNTTVTSLSNITTKMNVSTTRQLSNMTTSSFNRSSTSQSNTNVSFSTNFKTNSSTISRTSITNLTTSTKFNFNVTNNFSTNFSSTPTSNAPSTSTVVSKYFPPIGEFILTVIQSFYNLFG